MTRRRALQFGSMLGAAATLPGCSAAGLLNATISRAGLLVRHDVPYGTGPRQRMDIYRPAAGGPAPVIVFFYGGAWRSGSKATYPFVAATLARRGNVVVVPDYRLFPEVRYPVFLQDCAGAVAWTAANMAQIGGDPDRLFLMGHSAGAYNAAMLGLDARLLTAAGFSRDRLAGVIGLAGPYDFYPITDKGAQPVFAGAADGPATQPINHVDRHAPPMLLLAGEADETVRPRNTRALAERLRAQGDTVEARLYPGIGHIGLVTAIAPLFQARAPILAEIEAFVAAHAAVPHR